VELLVQLLPGRHPRYALLHPGLPSTIPPHDRTTKENFRKRFQEKSRLKLIPRKKRLKVNAKLVVFCYFYFAFKNTDFKSQCTQNKVILFKKKFHFLVRSETAELLIEPEIVDTRG
jgi:hypothetical protein